MFSAVNHGVMVHLGSLESTQEARVEAISSSNSLAQTKRIVSINV